MIEGRQHGHDRYSAYLFAYFTGDAADGEQVRFARSRGDDVLRWDSINGGRPLVISSVGHRGARDPFLLRAAGLPGESARFYLLATDLRMYGRDTAEEWESIQRYGSRSIVIWESVDLVTWSAPRLVEVAPSNAGNTWAPEAVYDPLAQKYMVFWASRLYGSERERATEPSYNRMLIAATSDFRKFEPAEVWIDPGHSVIDTTVVNDGFSYFRFTKDERTPDSSTPAAKFLTAERSTKLDSSHWDLITEGVGAPNAEELGAGVGLVHGEGPIAVKANHGPGWYLLVDEFGLRGYVPFYAPDIDSSDWRICEDYQLPAGARHGSILAITTDEWRRFDAVT